MGVRDNEVLSLFVDVPVLVGWLLYATERVIAREVYERKFERLSGGGCVCGSERQSDVKGGKCLP